MMPFEKLTNIGSGFNHFTIEVSYANGITKEAKHPSLSPNSVRWNEGDESKNLILNDFVIIEEKPKSLTLIPKTSSRHDDDVVKIKINFFKKRPKVKKLDIGPNDAA